MKPVVEKVLERLAYERLLLTSGLQPKKRQITLDDMLEAGNEEPRVYQVLPALLLYKPKIIKGVQKALAKQGNLLEKAQNIFKPDAPDKYFFGIPVADCRRVALAFQNYLRMMRQKSRHRLFNLRLNDEDWESLVRVARLRGTPNYSDIVRTLIHEAAKQR